MPASSGVYICAHIMCHIGYSPFDGQPRYSAIHCWLNKVDEHDVLHWSRSLELASLFSGKDAEIILKAIKAMPEYNKAIFEVHFHTENEIHSHAEIPSNIRELLKI